MAKQLMKTNQVNTNNNFEPAIGFINVEVLTKSGKRAFTQGIPVTANDKESNNYKWLLLNAGDDASNVNVRISNVHMLEDDNNKSIEDLL